MKTRLRTLNISTFRKNFSGFNRAQLPVSPRAGRSGVQRNGRVPKPGRHAQLLSLDRDQGARISARDVCVLYHFEVLEIFIESHLVQLIAPRFHALGVGVGLAAQVIDANVELELRRFGGGLTARRDFRDALRLLACAGAKQGSAKQRCCDKGRRPALMRALRNSASRGSILTAHMKSFSDNPLIAGYRFSPRRLCSLSCNILT